MDNIDELLERLTERGAGQYRHEEDTGSIQWMVKPDPDCEEAATSLRAQQAEIERLKGDYARGIEDAAKWHDKEIVEITSQLDHGIANSDGETQMVLERIFHKRVATEIRALIPKQKEGE